MSSTPAPFVSDAAPATPPRAAVPATPAPLVVSTVPAMPREAETLAAPAAQTAGAPPHSKRGRRRILFAALGATVLLTAGAGALYEHFYGAYFVSTDNAYTASESAQVTPWIPGIVRQVKVSDTDHVKAGQVLVVLDDDDANLALAQADAELGRAVRRVRGYVANDASLAAEIAARETDEQRASAQLGAARADLERAGIDLQRREALAASGSVSGDELTRARNAYQGASAAVLVAQAQTAQAHANRAAARGSRQANAALIADADEASNPEVALARAKRDQARINLERTVIRAPVEGVVARRAVQIGQQVQAGAALLTIVPVGQIYVDANFKEGQLHRVRVGQPVEVRSDVYGRSVTYHGVVDGLAGGTGSSFATIPTQNATGNWIKVVQRVPVRIAIDTVELNARPLQIGLSMTATVDTRERATVRN